MPDPSNSDVVPEFSRLVPVTDLEQGEIVRHLVAEPAELAALQTRFAIEALHAASADLTITPQPENTVKVEGAIHATLSQMCVVSLEPIDETVDETLSVTFLPPGVEEPAGGPDGELESEEDFDTFDGITIDLGELVAQHIAAALNPYPRKDGVVFGNQGQLGDNAGEERDNPFAVLQKLKDQDGSTQKH